MAIVPHDGCVAQERNRMTEVTGTTDLDLQKALIEEIKKINLDWRKPGTAGQWIDWKYYRQMKPYKQDMILTDADGTPLVDEDGHPIMIPDETRDLDQENYIIVMIDDEDMNSNGEWVVQIIMIVSMYCEDPEQQGNMVIQDVLNRIWMGLAKKGIIADRYEMEPFGRKRFNQEAITNFYEGILITKWKLPRVFPEEVSKYV